MSQGWWALNLQGNFQYNVGNQAVIASNVNFTGAQRTITVNDGTDLNDLKLTGQLGVAAVLRAAGGRAGDDRTGAG